MNTPLTVVTEETRADFLQAVIQGDEQGARKAIDQGLQAAIPWPKVITDVVGVSMEEIEKRKFRGIEENRVTYAAESALSYLESKMKNPTLGLSAAVALLERDTSLTWPRLICDLLRADGWDVTWLAAVESMGELVGWVEEAQPSLVVLYIHQAKSADRLGRVVSRIKKLKVRPPTPKAKKRKKEERLPPVVMIAGKGVRGSPIKLRQAGADAIIADPSNVSLRARLLVVTDKHDQIIRDMFGARLRELRMQCGLNQTQLGEKADLHRTYICNLEAGRHNPQLVMCYKLARALDLPIHTLIPEVELPPIDPTQPVASKKTRRKRR